MEPAEITKDEFLRRFKARMLLLLGEHYDFKYMDYVALTYWEDEDYREDGPEACAEAEFGEWGEE